MLIKIYSSTVLILIHICLFSVHAQQREHPVWESVRKQPATLHLDRGEHSFALPQLKGKILKASQTISSLQQTSGDRAFNYTPVELLDKRDRNLFFHLGDINLRIRKVSDTAWVSYSTASDRHDIQALPAGKGILAAADLSPTLSNIPLHLKRTWKQKGDDLVLEFEIYNPSDQAFEIGSLGIPLPFNNNLDGKNLDEAHAKNVFLDPYIGLDAGYVQVNHLHGKGVSLLVLPEENAQFEAYNPLNTDPTPRSITFEGFHEWMIHSKAHAETDWKGVDQWNNPTSTILQPNERKTFALRFVLAPAIRDIEPTLVQNNRPLAVGFPGFVVPLNNPAKLFVQYGSPIKHINVYPKQALSVTKNNSSSNKWSSYQIKGNRWGRARLTLTYEDGKQQTIHYKVIKPERDVVNDLGRFLTTKQWYEDPQDPFKRSPSIITYDNEVKRQVTEEQRAWYAGLSDEAGAGSWLAAMMKQVVQPNAEEITKLKRFMNETLYGDIQHKSGKDHYGVVKSLFYYEPDSLPAGTYSDSINYTTWSAWPKKEADNIGRSYNYPHVAAAHWVFYRLARNYPHLVAEESWDTYLERAFQTSVAMVEKAPHYAQFGQMEGSIFLIILKDLQREGKTAEAAKLEALMRERAAHWRTLNYPFGSEMPWDSTGQEEVYLWSDYFGFDDKATVTLNAILAYMPTVPHWGYNGSARRYWDFVYGGKLSRIERQLHHYGSALNAIPVLSAYRSTPDDYHLLRIGHAGMLGALANVTEEGFAPGAFHSYPSTLANDGITGDYGSGFYGYAAYAGTYVVQHPEFGWLAFSGNVKEDKKGIQVEVTTASRSRVFLGPERLMIQAESGEIAQIDYQPKTGDITLILAKSGDNNPATRLRLEQESESYAIAGSEKDTLGRYVIPAGTKQVKLQKVSR
ncbi:DUF5695 domain-containing protein [Sphingobacterium sp. lm-10]|uniref:DUF5695 domain-containing protein n=1 Tax=Sphingobacterium sp. lm-10 TaxID=2944904 RepID=UPI002021CA7E|nr:DUF5695 domain-containing protein [Sphingobacterium sp. lm-10]MCL7986735.1 DUF5695 domain-containing protein [Sphingobacterium sp. lm-10]